METNSFHSGFLFVAGMAVERKKTQNLRQRKMDSVLHFSKYIDKGKKKGHFKIIQTNKNN